MSTTATTMADFITLSSVNYFARHMSVLTAYHGSCTDCSAHGLFDRVATDAKWLKQNGGDASKARPVRELPGDLPNNASAAATAADNRLRTQHASTTLMIAALKCKLLISIGSTNVLNLEDTDTGTMFLTERQIMIAMDLKYNKLDESTLRAWKAQLLQPILAADNIEDFLATSTKIHKNLARVKQPMAESDKIENATQALVPRTSAGLAIQQYKLLHPNVNDRTFADFNAYLFQQVPNVTISTSTMNYAAHASADFDAHVAVAVAAKLAEMGFAAGMQARPGFMPVATKTRARSDKYCYVHGYCAHSGTICRNMLADPKLYSKAMLGAKDHMSVAGGSTKNS